MKLLSPSSRSIPHCVPVRHHHRALCSASHTLSSSPSASTRRGVSTATNTTTGTTKKVSLRPDGRPHWSSLSVPGKAARATEQSFYSLVILIGAGGLLAVGTIWYLDVFSHDSKTAIFNRATDRVKADRRCIELLGEATSIMAWGDRSMRRGRRQEGDAPKSSSETDKMGTEHFRMEFPVVGEKNRGVVRLHLVRRSGQSDYEYRYLALEVKGHEAIYLEKAGADKFDNRADGKMFGVRWW